MSVREEVLTRLDFVSLVSKYVDLEPSGEEFRGLCPFHQEKTPSFFIHPVKKVYHCFGCGASGDAISFYAEINKIPYREALLRLARELGVPLRERERNEKRVRVELALLEKAKKLFIRTLWSAHPFASSVVRPYLKNRGITREIAVEFGLGACPPDQGFVQRNLGAPPDLLERVGLVVGGRDFFAGRLMIPIHNERGEVVGFSGRVLGEGKPKYKNTPTTEYFEKRKILYNLHNVYKRLRDVERVYVVEGYMDVFAMWRFGFFAVAPMGTSLTEEHGAILKSLNREIWLVFDGDEAGLKGAERGIRKLLKGGCSRIRVVTLPEGEDPDSILTVAGDSSPLEKSKSWVEFVVDRWGDRDYFTGRSRIKDFFQMIENLTDEERLSALNDFASIYSMELRKLVEEELEWRKRERKKETVVRIKERRQRAVCYTPEELPFLRMMFFGEIEGLGAMVAYLDEKDVDGELTKFAAKKVKEGNALDLSDSETVLSKYPHLKTCLERLKSEKFVSPLSTEEEVLQFLLGLKIKRVRRGTKNSKYPVEVFKTLSNFVRKGLKVLKNRGNKSEIVELLEFFTREVEPLLDK